MIPEKLLSQMSGLYQNFKVNPSRITGTFKLTDQYGLNVDGTKKSDEWTVFNAETGDFLSLGDVPGSILKLVKPFKEDWDKLNGGTDKDPLENLKDGGFEIGGDAPGSPTKVSPIETPAEVENVEPVQADESADKAKAEREENLRKLAEYERLQAEAEERKIIELEKRENIKESAAPSKKSEWKKGGYKGKFPEIRVVPEIRFEDTEIVRPVVTARKPNRTIRGLTPRLAECGKIKIGRKGEMTSTATGKQFRLPEKIDHFLITTMDKVNDDFAPDAYLMKTLGENCREIPVRLPYDDPSLNFPTSYAYYDSAACKCRGDGLIALNSDGETIECNPETCPNIQNKKCKPNGVLSLILDDAPRVGGVYKFRTTGWNSINNIFSSMEFIRGLTNGLLAGLPLMLTLTPKHTVIPGTRTSTTIYMVNLEYRGSLQDMVNAIQQTMNTRALMQYSVKDFEKLAEESLALPEAPDECKAIAEEFYPEIVRGV